MVKGVGCGEVRQADPRHLSISSPATWAAKPEVEPRENVPLVGRGRSPNILLDRDKRRPRCDQVLRPLVAGAAESPQIRRIVGATQRRMEIAADAKPHRLPIILVGFAGSGSAHLAHMLIAFEHELLNPPRDRPYARHGPTPPRTRVSRGLLRRPPTRDGRSRFCLWLPRPAFQRRESPRESGDHPRKAPERVVRN